MSNSQFRLIACPSLSHERRADCYCDVGRAVADYLRELGWTRERMSARVTIDGILIPEAEWETIMPQAGQAMIVRAIPQGGGNGQGGKQAVQIAAMLALTVAAIYVGGAEAGFLAGKVFSSSSLTYGALAGTGLLVGGSLALHGHIPAPRPRRELTEAT